MEVDNAVQTVLLLIRFVWSHLSNFDTQSAKEADFEPAGYLIHSSRVKDFEKSK